MKVIKRDGRVVEFDKSKITNAVLKAYQEVDGEIKEQSVLDAENITGHICKRLHDESSVEEIQDMVEKELMKSSRKDVAKAYVIYRNDRTRIRERNSKLVKVVMDRVRSSVDNHSNANVDEKSFSGREKEASADVGKTIALDFGGLSDEVAQAHKEMLIYQHDLEKAIYGIHNCLNLNFKEIFTSTEG